MSIKIINITIPGDAIIPDVLSTFSPEENYIMLKIGSETLSEGRKVVANLTSDEIFKKVRNDFEKEIDVNMSRLPRCIPKVHVCPSPPNIAPRNSRTIGRGQLFKIKFGSVAGWSTLRPMIIPGICSIFFKRDVGILTV